MSRRGGLTGSDGTCGRGTMRRRVCQPLAAAAIATLVAVAVPVAGEEPRSGSRDEEIKQLREELDRQRQATEALEKRLKDLEAKEAEDKKEAAAEAESAPRRYLERYFGEDRFVLTGWGAATYAWDRNSGTNTFLATFDPIFLYRVTDWILFEAEPEFELDQDGDTEINLEYAQADLVLNKYMTFVGGKFLLPFGEFIQQLHPGWINKLASNPLPYREAEDGGIMPFSDVGAQLRGGVRLFGTEGVGLEYTAFIGNGPRFDSPDVGAPFNTNNVDNNRGKGYGARIAGYPLPLASDLGRLQLGASTFDGQWSDTNGLWFTSWGIDGAYQLDEFELRAEYLQTHRRLAPGMGNDNRNGWYVQTAYRLGRVPVSVLKRFELVARYSGVNQRAVTDPELVPHDRQVAFGVDYWLTPSVVGKLEYDLYVPEDAENDDAVRAQIAVGF